MSVVALFQCHVFAYGVEKCTVRSDAEYILEEPEVRYCAS